TLMPAVVRGFDIAALCCSRPFVPHAAREARGDRQPNPRTLKGLRAEARHAPLPPLRQGCWSCSPTDLGGWPRSCPASSMCCLVILVNRLRAERRSEVQRSPARDRSPRTI